MVIIKTSPGRYLSKQISWITSGGSPLSLTKNVLKESIRNYPNDIYKTDFFPKKIRNYRKIMKRLNEHVIWKLHEVPIQIRWFGLKEANFLLRLIKYAIK